MGQLLLLYVYVNADCKSMLPSINKVSTVLEYVNVTHIRYAFYWYGLHELELSIFFS